MFRLVTIGGFHGSPTEAQVPISTAIGAFAIATIPLGMVACRTTWKGPANGRDFLASAT